MNIKIIMIILRYVIKCIIKYKIQLNNEMKVCR
jgi:hypothetical protein